MHDALCSGRCRSKSMKLCWMTLFTHCSLEEKSQNVSYPLASIMELAVPKIIILPQASETSMTHFKKGPELFIASASSQI